MSRAFVKEDDSPEAVEGTGQRRVESGPAYITPGGLAALRAWRDELQQALASHHDSEVQAALHRGRLTRDLEYVEARLAQAVPVDPARQPRDRVAFGALVRAEALDGTAWQFRIVGTDEAAPEEGRIGYRAPLARAALGAEIGDVIRWERPAGAIELEIVAIDYPTE